MFFNYLTLELADEDFGIAICTLVQRYKTTTFGGEYYVEDCKLNYVDESDSRCYGEIKHFIAECRMSGERKATPNGSSVLLTGGGTRIIVDEICYLGDGVFAFVQYNVRHLSRENQLVLVRRCGIKTPD